MGEHDMKAKAKGLTEQAMDKRREAHQWRGNAETKQSGDGGLDMRLARRLDAEADAMLTVHGNDLPVTSMGEVAAPHIAGLRATGKGFALDTLQQPGIIPEEASIRRTDLLFQDSLDIVPMAIDASASIEAGNSLEKMLAHQMALAHEMAMRTGNAAMRELDRLKLTQIGHARRTDQGVEYQRLANSTAKLMGAFQQGMLTLQRLRSGGNQTMTVQHVHVESGGQALIGTVQAGGKLQGEASKK